MNKQDWSLPVFRWPALHRISPLTTSRCCVFVVSDLTKEPSQEPALCCFNLNPCKLWARRTFLIYKLSSFRHFVITVGNSHPKGILGKEETGTMSGRKREEWNNDIRKMFPHILSCQKKKKRGDPPSMRDMLSPSFMSWGIDAQKEKNDLPCLGDCCSKTQPRAQTL